MKNIKVNQYLYPTMYLNDCCQEKVATNYNLFTSIPQMIVVYINTISKEACVAQQ